MVLIDRILSLCSRDLVKEAAQLLAVVEVVLVDLHHLPFHESVVFVWFWRNIILIDRFFKSSFMLFGIE